MNAQGRGQRCGRPISCAREFRRGRRKVKLWDAVSGSLLRTFEHSYWVISVAVTADGTRIVSGGIDGRVKLWDAANGSRLSTFQHLYWVTSVAVTPDGTRVVSGGGDIKIWDTRRLSGPQQEYGGADFN